MRPRDLDAEVIAALDVGDGDVLDQLAALMDEVDARRPTPTLGPSALWYAGQGLKIFPLQPRAKLPYKGTHGCLDASNDVDQVRAWWQARGDSNIGIATGHLVDVIDIDGPIGVRSWARMDVEEMRQLSVGHVSTPRPGGNHIYLPAQPGRTNKATLFPGVDTRGAGGYVVAPPSVTEQGTYRWIAPLDLGAQ